MASVWFSKGYYAQRLATSLDSGGKPYRPVLVVSDAGDLIAATHISPPSETMKAAFPDLEHISTGKAEKVRVIAMGDGTLTGPAYKYAARHGLDPKAITYEILFDRIVNKPSVQHAAASVADPCYDETERAERKHFTSLRGAWLTKNFHVTYKSNDIALEEGNWRFIPPPSRPRGPAS